MWKKTAVVAVLAALPMSSAMAKDSTGCGVGTMIFDGQEGVIPQVLAVTTNGTSGNQTFGITSGTLGCDQDGVVQSDAKLTAFVSSNMEKLAADMASGNGETLASAAELMNVPESDRAAFYQAAKDDFASIYGGEQVTAGQVVEGLQDAASRTTA
ncbi:hypothetical protein AN478_04440 [Thiohalorhabdus denitrificans]|uniref:DUF3015 domain-containing protein n=1 Tax=Thiohalorhabdus denitrificans TaxID=381306 RepID=A0A0P9ERL7_9GAMM|nr:DUF3015 family protein [Thiohalorhabdus denitrificans]KPV41151.1 hypothetical protein AN478_04440 [Thiohalorhabdus denitrificans]SCY36450.1 Protein of unknown function [Thiohalorhabdus denitrificans]